MCLLQIKSSNSLYKQLYKCNGNVFSEQVNGQGRQEERKTVFS